MVNEIELRRLVIKAFHMNQVSLGDKFSIANGVLEINPSFLDKLVEKEEFVDEMKINIILPGQHDRWTDSIMDIFPISTKVLGVLGEGITHTVTGAYCMLAGRYNDGTQVAEFGSSEGQLNEQLRLNRAGTPSDTDIIIAFDCVLKANDGDESARSIPTAAHRVCDTFVQEIRNVLKKVNGNSCTERHEFYDKIRPEGKKVVIVKQVAGQGAMYDTQLYSNEPSGFAGGRSIIDMGNVPVIVTPNEYRDGAIRAMH